MARRIRRVTVPTIIAAFLAALIGLAAEALRPARSGNAESVSVTFHGTPESTVVARVVDGDTLHLADGRRVRLIGIDTPEIHESAKLRRDSERTRQDIQTIKALGRQSFEFTRTMVEGKPVRLEYDVERQDKYKRLLAYVYLEDGTFVNAEIVRQGYANLLTIPPNVRYADLFKQYYAEARENRRGLWK